jgi:hypothetical protein
MKRRYSFTITRTYTGVVEVEVPDSGDSCFEGTPSKKGRDAIRLESAKSDIEELADELAAESYDLDVNGNLYKHDIVVVETKAEPTHGGI